MSFANVDERIEKALASVSGCTAAKRLEMLFDDGAYTELERFAVSDGECEVLTAYGYVSGSPAYAFSQNISASSGAMGRAQADKILRLYKKAAQTGLPIFAIYDSKGAHLNEGAGALAAYGDLIAASNRISGVVPQISLVLGSCIGSAAVLASIADVVIMTEKAELYVTSGKILGEKKVGSAAAAAAAGTAQITADDDASAIGKAKELITLLPINNLSVAPIADYVQASSVAAQGADAVSVAAAVADADSLFELSAEYGRSVYTALCRIGGNSVGIVANAKDNDGRMDAAGCFKAARFVRMCDAFSIPVVTLVDTFGFDVTAESELSGGVKAMASLTHAYAEATTPKVSVIVGNAIGAAYTALAGSASGADVTLAWKNAVIAPVEPLTAVSVLYADRIDKGEKREDLVKEYVVNEGSVFEAATAGYVDDIIAPEDTFAMVLSALEMLSGKRVSTMDKKHSNMPF